MPGGEIERIELSPGQLMRIDADLNPSEKEHIASLLREFSDLFAWRPTDMPDIDPQVISHHLVINPQVRPIIQKGRPMGA